MPDPATNPTKSNHCVHVIGLATVYNGRNEREAHRAFSRWSKFAREPVGRASGKTVVRLVNGKIVEKRMPITKNILQTEKI